MAGAGEPRVASGEEDLQDYVGVHAMSFRARFMPPGSHSSTPSCPSCRGGPSDFQAEIPGDLYLPSGIAGL
jgi:hypothetical protein